MQMHQCICNSKANFRYYEITAGGKNALDFQLSTFLGFLISKNPEESFYIISKDRGFQRVIGFWEERKNDFGISELKLIRKTSISAEDTPAEQPEETSAEENIISETVTAETQQDDDNDQINGDTIRSVIQSMDDISSNTVLHKQLVFKLGHEQGSYVYHTIGTKTALSRQEFHKKLVAQFGQANGTVIYNKLKKLIKK